MVCICILRVTIISTGEPLDSRVLIGAREMRQHSVSRHCLQKTGRGGRSVFSALRVLALDAQGWLLSTLLLLLLVTGSAEKKEAPRTDV